MTFIVVVKSYMEVSNETSDNEAFHVQGLVVTVKLLLPNQIRCGRSEVHVYVLKFI